MKILIGSLEHISIITILLLIFSQNYFGFKYIKDYALIDQIITNLTVNLAAFTLSNYMLSFVGVETKYIYQGAIVLILILTLNNLIRNSKSVMMKMSQSKIKKIITLFGPAILISIWQFLPTLTLLNSSANSLNMTSIGNNDIANYALTAKEYLFSGFINSGHFPDVDLNKQARDIQHLTVHLMISFTSFVFNLEVWKVMNSVMIFTITLNVIALTKLFQICFKRESILLTFIAVSVAVLNPLNSYIIHHYFLSQSLALFVFSLIILKAHAIYKKDYLENIDKIEIIAIVVLSILTYPSILIPSVIGLFLINILIELFTQKRKFKISKLKYRDVILFGLVGVLLSIYYLPRAILILFRHATMQSGWELPAPNAVGFLLSPYYISNEISNLVSVIIWVGLNLVILCICILNIKSRNSSIYFICIAYLIIFVYLLQVMVRGQGFGHYQNWKLISYILPILIIIFAAEILKLKNIGVILLTPFLIAGLNAPKSLWKNGNEVGTPSIISRDLIDLMTIKDKYEINSLNVIMGSFYQTMVVGLVTDMKKIYFTSPTYYPVNSDKNLCSLVENSDVRFPNKVQINESYSLISSENLNCDVVNPENLFKISENKKIVFDKFNIQNRLILDRGWSYPEDWGTWAVGQKSNMRFNLNQERHLESFINFNIIWPVPKTVKYSESTITLNGLIIGKLDSYNNKDSISFKVSNLKKMNNIISFTNADPVSPKSLGISDDQRSLSIGITNFSVTNSY